MAASKDRREDPLPVSEIKVLQCVISGHNRRIDFLPLRKFLAKMFARGHTVHSTDCTVNPAHQSFF
jgi:hypothetical protein